MEVKVPVQISIFKFGLSVKQTVLISIFEGDVFIIIIIISILTHSHTHAHSILTYFL